MTNQVSAARASDIQFGIFDLVFTWRWSRSFLRILGKCVFSACLHCAPFARQEKPKRLRKSCLHSAEALEFHLVVPHGAVDTRENRCTIAVASKGVLASLKKLSFFFFSASLACQQLHRPNCSSVVRSCYH